MICGQVPLVVVPTMVSWTPLLGVPGGGTQAFVQVGGSKFQLVPHSTVLFVGHNKVNAHPLVGVTVKGIRHCAEVPRLSVTVKVMYVVPGPTLVPAGGV
jgi:hypothetical protein